MTPRIVHGWKTLTPADRGAAVALGNFDGVHKGHQSVIAGAAEAAKASGAPLAVITFDPHPRRLFQPDEPAFRLMTIEQQARALGEMGVDLLYVLNFDFEMANFSDRGFVGPGAARGPGRAARGGGLRHLVRQGAHRQSRGDGRPTAPRLGFSVSVARGGRARGRTASSRSTGGARRAARRPAAGGRGDPRAAVRHRGTRSVRGQQLGRPLRASRRRTCPLADYVAPQLRASTPPAPACPTAAVGRRAWRTSASTPRPARSSPRLEVWLFDFDEDLYGQVIETQLIAFLRPEEKFASIDEMVLQIRRDETAARGILGA
jgi:riboflavin kinase/FMN adenylyltransferase